MSSHATQIAIALAAGRKANQLYPESHPEFVASMDALTTAIAEATASGPFQMNVHKGRLYHQDTPVSEDAPGVKAVQEAFESRSIESITLHPGVEREEAVALVEILGLKPSPDLDVDAELQARSVTHVTVAFLEDEDSEEREERERLREQDRALYNRLVSIMRTVSAKVAQEGSPDLAGAGELVGTVMQRLMADQSAMLGLATIRGQSETSLFHSINVMIYSLTLGAALGLPEEGLASLGISALLHDLGKAAFDSSDPRQLGAMRVMHPKTGADILSRLPEEDKAPMLVAYEHHMGVDGGGFPERDTDYVAHPYSRMVAIANRYANFTDPQDANEPLTPDAAIIRLLELGGTELDPLFTRLFVKSMGVFPVGCMVRLSDQSVGVVSKPGEDALTPSVRVLYDPAGMEIEKPDDIALAESDLRIIEVVEAESLNTEVSDHL